MVIYLHCTTNNESCTVPTCFEDAVRKYSIPSRVRTDHGFENLGIVRFMLPHKGLNQGNIITGSSLPNQRVERLHLDVTTGVFSHFLMMERSGLLDPTMKFIYLPFILFS